MFCCSALGTPVYAYVPPPNSPILSSLVYEHSQYTLGPLCKANRSSWSCLQNIQHSIRRTVRKKPQATANTPRWHRERLSMRMRMRHALQKMQYSTYHISGPWIIQIAIEGVFHTYKFISLRSYRCPGSNIQSCTCQFYSIPAYRQCVMFTQVGLAPKTLQL